MIQILTRRPLVFPALLYIIALAVFHVRETADEISDGVPLEMECRVSGDPEPCSSSDPDIASWKIPVDAAGLRMSVYWRDFEWRDAPGYGEVWIIRGVKRGRRGILADERRCELVKMGTGSRLIHLCYSGRRASSDILEAGVQGNEDKVGIIRAVVLGYRSGLSRQLRELFCSTGTLHIFAISGLHVGIIAVLTAFVLKLLGVPRNRWILWMLPVLVCYTVMTGGRASAVRACIMMIILYAAPFFSRKADALSSLSLAAIVILAVRPSQVFDLGFIYSFTVVTGLVILCPPIEKKFAGVFRRDPLLLPGQEGRLRRVLRHITSAGLSLAVVSVAAWLVSAPLTLYFFGRFTPISIVSNLLVVPLTASIVATGCISIIAGSCVSLFAIAFNNMNLLFVTVLLKVLRLSSSVPLGSIDTGTVPVWVPLVWYSAIAAGFCIFRKIESEGAVENDKEI